MKVVQFPGDRQVEVRDFPQPEPGAMQVLLQLKAAGICRSDMEGYYHGLRHEGQLIIPGHEPAGVAAAVGSDVRSVKPGDRIAVYHGIGCGRCRYCRRGNLMACPEASFYGFHRHGGDADYMLVDEAHCLRLPEWASFVEGALVVDVIGTMFQALRRLEVSGLTSVAIFGLGPMGTAGVMLARAMGATNIIGIDLMPDRLSFAGSLGASAVINASKQNPVAAIRDLTGGQGSDVTVDCTGSERGELDSLEAAAHFGRVAFVGEGERLTLRPAGSIIRKQLTLIGSWIFNLHDYDLICQFVKDHNLPLEHLVTHRFSLADAPEAFSRFDARETLKVVFIW